MSHIYKITTTQRIDIIDLINQLREKRIAAYGIDKHPTYLIYEDGFSTRGVEITEEDYGYELRMTVLSNSNDYLLCNEIAFIVCNTLNAVLTDQEGDERFIGKLFYDKDISDFIKTDINTLFALFKEGHDIDIFGPNREFSFGEQTRKKVLALQGDTHAIAYKLFKIIQACQYPPENFVQHANLLRVTDKEGEEYLVQVISNTRDIVIEKVKQYAIALSEKGDSLILDTKELAPLIPAAWQILDDYVMLATKLDDGQWNEFVERVKIFCKSKG